MLKGENLSTADLSGANLRAADIRGVDFIGANLEGADLLWAVIMSPKVREEFQRAASGSTIMGQDTPSGFLGSPAGGFEIQASRARSNQNVALEIERRATRWADLRDAIFVDANLKGANLSEADLRGTNFTQANLNGANLENVLIRAIGIFRKRCTNFSGANLSAVRNVSRNQLNDAIIDEKTILTD